MTLTIGRVTLQVIGRLRPSKTKQAGRATGTTGVARSIDQLRQPEVFQITGIETGASAETTMRDLADEVDRIGDLYVEDTNAELVAGYYKLLNRSVDTEHPNLRPWTLTLEKIIEPLVTRQAEDDNEAGTDTVDSEAEEGSKVAYTTTGSYVTVLKHGRAGGEKLNLPAGIYQVRTRVKSASVASDVRARLTQTDGTVIQTGSDVSPSTANVWKDLNLGNFTVSDANAGANIIEIQVKEGTTIDLDRTRIIRTGNLTVQSAAATIAGGGVITATASVGENLLTESGEVLQTEAGEDIQAQT